MTALASRRRRATLVAAGVTITAVAVVASLAAAGALTLYHSTDGETAGSDLPELTFPDTATALLAAVDPGGALASLVVVVVQPDGSGGSLVPVPVSADATAGEGDDRLPLAESVELEGPAVLGREAQIALSLSFDDVAVVGAERLEELLAPVGEVTVELPADVVDAAGDVVAGAGESMMDAGQLAAVLTARDRSRPAADQYGASEAVWAAVADAAGEGIAGDEAAPASGGRTAPEVLRAALSGPVRSRGLSWAEIDADRNPRDADVVVLDRVELSLIFGQIAPGRVAAPNPSLSFRVVAAYSADQLGDRGWTNADVAYRAIAQIQFLRGNVLSVDTAPEEAEEATILELNDVSVVNTDGLDTLFGDVEVRDGETRVVGVDAVIHLGTRYLDVLDEQVADAPSEIAAHSPDEGGGVGAGVVPVGSDGPARTAPTTEDEPG